MSILFTCLIYTITPECNILATPPLFQNLGITLITAAFYAPIIIFFTKLFSKYDLQFLPNYSRKNNFSRFLATFVITPNNGSSQITHPLKFSLICFFTKIKSNILIIWSNIFLKISNFIKIVKLPKYLLWRPLFKKSSYYGLFVHARTNFLKIFK